MTQPTQTPRGLAVRVQLLGPFAITLGDRVAGSWQRPTARRLCALVLVSPGRRMSRDLIGEELFADLEPRAAARSVSKALSMARSTLAALGDTAADLLEADLEHIWASPAAEVDADEHEQALRAGLALAPGLPRDDCLVAALSQDGVLLADEPYADWAIRPREGLEALRQEARLALARDRAKGAGRAAPDAVVQSWEACLEHDPACEEAAIALIRAYFGQGHREAATRTYQQCAAALAELGLRSSPALDDAYAVAATRSAPSRSAGGFRPAPEQEPLTEEVRTVSLLSAGVSAPARLSADHGLEMAREVISSTIAALITEVESLGGTVTSVSGGGLQAMFGAPEANEDDPERAVRAAFRAMSSVAAAAVRPAVRIGVETGQAVTGPIGAGGRVEYAPVGDVVDVAAALQSAARPGTVLVGPVTHAAVRHLFTWIATETVQLPLDGTEVSGTYLDAPRPGAASRAVRVGGRSRLVGREGELAALGSAARDMLAGRGNVVLITGEAGLGKTRLVQEVRARFAAGRRPGRLWLEGRSASYASATPYGLYQQVLANWAKVAPDQPDAVLRPALEKALGSVGAADLLPLLARLMGLSAGAALGQMSAADLQRAVFGAMRSLVARLAQEPTILVLEDLHWADPTSVSLTAHLAKLTAGHQLLILVTGRPDGEPQFAALEGALGAAPPVRRISLGPLPASVEQDLARSLLGESASDEALKLAVSGADGNPLFLEERLTSLQETGILVRADETWLLGDTPGPVIPMVLERLVRSRVDRLSHTAQTVVRLASVLGTEFGVSLLAAVSSPDLPVRPVIDELSDRDFLREVSGRGEPALRFRHDLLQEAIYNGLLPSERRLLHGRAAYALEAASQGRRDDVAAILGRHFAAAGQTERAVRYLSLAGDHATAAFANDEALSAYRAALAIVSELPADERGAAAADLHAGLANVLWRTGRRAETRQAFQNALAATDPADTGRRVHLLTRLGRLEMTDRRYEAAATAFDAAQALVGGQPADDGEVTTDQWLELMVDGRAALSTFIEPGRALATLEAARPMLVARGNAARMHSFYLYLALAQVAANGFRVDEADIALMRRSLEAARDSDEKDVGYSTCFLGRLLLLHGDLEAAREQLAAALAIAERIGESHLVAQSLVELSLLALRQHDVEKVRSTAASAVAAATAVSNMENVAGATACLAWLAWQDGRPADVIARSGEVEHLQQAHDLAGSHDLWVRLWPLVAVHLDAGRVAQAVDAARELLGPTGPRLPGDLRAELEAAATAWEAGDEPACRDQLAGALARARDLRYC